MRKKLTTENNVEVREGRMVNDDGEQFKVKIVDQGEGFENGNGTPNHDKVYIEYP